MPLQHAGQMYVCAHAQVLHVHARHMPAQVSVMQKSNVDITITSAKNWAEQPEVTCCPADYTRRALFHLRLSKHLI